MLPLLASGALLAACGGDDAEPTVDPDEADRAAASLVRNVVSAAESCRAEGPTPDERCRKPESLTFGLGSDRRIASAIVAGKPGRGQVAVQSATGRRLRVLAVSESGNRFAFTAQSRAGGGAARTFSCVTPGHSPSAICRDGSWGGGAADDDYGRQLEQACGGIVALRADLVRGVQELTPASTVDEADALPGIRNLYAATYERTAELTRALTRIPGPARYAAFQRALRRLEPVLTRSLRRRATKARSATTLAALERVVAATSDPTEDAPDVAFPRDLRTAAPSCRNVVPRTTG